MTDTPYGECPIKANVKYETGIKAFLKRLVKTPVKAISGSLWFRIKDHVKNDKVYAYINYWVWMHRRLHLKSPKTFNEKLQWLMLYNRNPEYIKLVDKHAVKDYVAECIGAEHIIPTLGVWDRFDEIDFDALPQQFVLKTTHDSGTVVICKDKSKLDKVEAKEKLESRLCVSYYDISREWPYKGVKPRIIAEQYMEDESGYELKDYKFFCFDGEVKMFNIISDRPNDTRLDFFDTDFNHLPFAHRYPWARHKLDKPEKFDEMIDIARRLSKGFPHVRVDLYNINGKIYFGELTFFNSGGIIPFFPEKWDYKIGEWLTLPDTKLS